MSSNLPWKDSQLIRSQKHVAVNSKYVIILLFEMLEWIAPETQTNRKIRKMAAHKYCIKCMDKNMVYATVIFSKNH